MSAKVAVPLLVLAASSLGVFRLTSSNIMKYSGEMHNMAFKRRSKDILVYSLDDNNMNNITTEKEQHNTKSIAPSYNTTKKQDGKEYHYHDYAVFIVHYHKTGYVLSRELKNLVREIEVMNAMQHDDPTNFNSAKYTKPKKTAHEVSGVYEETGERFAFDQVGNWVRSGFPQRRHNTRSKCPPAEYDFTRGDSRKNKAKRKNKRRAGGRRDDESKVEDSDDDFELQMGKMYVQESPDLFCSDSDILSSINLSKGGTKIIHLVRNPFDMAISNYLYHAQIPSPEKWVESPRGDPCEDIYYKEESSLASYVVPTLSKWVNGTSKGQEVTQNQMDDVVDMCRSLFRANRHLKKATFYEHLLELDKYDGLRLATAHMSIGSGETHRHMAGGDILRMMNNVVKFQNIQRESSKVHVLTVSLDDFIRNATDRTVEFLDFVFGSNNNDITKEEQWAAALKQNERYERKKGNKHVTQTNPEDGKSKDELRSMLKLDKHLGPILNLTEVLVNDAL